MAGSRYVNITLDEMIDFMNENYFEIANPEATEEELTFIFSWHDDNYFIMIYSSIPGNGVVSRKKGQDAIRLVLFAVTELGIKPIWKSKKTYRTLHWRGNLQRKIDEAYERGLDGKVNWRCPQCGNPLVLRDTKRGTQFYGCSMFSKTKCSGAVHIDDMT